MKKKLIIGAIIAAVLILAGVLIYRAQKRKAEKPAPKPPTARTSNHPVGGVGAGITRERPGA